MTPIKVLPKPEWWRDLPATAVITLTKDELLGIIDSAVSEGRCYPDLYYGSDNEFHIAQILNDNLDWEWRFK